MHQNYELDLTAPVYIQGMPAQIISYEYPILELNPCDPLDELPSKVEIKQVVHTADPKEVACALQTHWNQYWQRDLPGDHPDCNPWTEFFQFQQQIPDMPEMEIERTDLSIWKEAIKGLKSKTARGACSWFADELKQLPDACVSSLAEVMTTMIDSGFPQWIMQAKTIPLAKKANADHPSATRPITILPLLYRLWGKVITSQILKKWNSTFHQAINGFLPGRSPVNFQYGLQLHLEAIAKNLTTRYLSGLTLDIIKAFNCLPRIPTAWLVKKFGVPPDLVDAWTLSIQNCTRVWSVNNQIWPQTSSTTGYPEGDAWSVIAMLAVNAYWVSHVLRITPRIGAFADNWSYSTENPHDHSLLIPLLDQLSSSLLLKIDWNKTWGWATNQEHKEALQAATAQHLPPEVKVATVSNARDLGYIIHYKVQQTRSTQRERHSSALAAIKKLRNMDIPSESKAQIAIASGYAKALWGTSFYLTGQKFFEELRTEFAKAMFGNHHNIQPYVATMALLKSGIDPELYVINASIRTARNFLMHASPADQKMFWRIVRQPIAHAAVIAGPAAALKQYLSKLDWTLNDKGFIQTTALTSMHLLHSNLSDILEAAADAWMTLVSEKTSTRRHMRNTPPIDREATQAAFATVPEKYQLCMGLEATGGFMLNTQKQHFTELEDGKCSYCDAMDTHRHRVLECPATHAVRANHQQICLHLQDAEEIHLVFPLAYKSPEDQLLKDLLYNLPEPEVNIPEQHVPSWIYTDGSCYLPTSKRFRWASFAIVYPIVPAKTLLLYRHLPPDILMQKAYHVAAVAIVPGRQTINRAELYSAVLAHEQRRQVVIVTDSAYVIHMHVLVRTTVNVATLHQLPNWDLLKRLHVLFWDHGYGIPIRKIKAHQTVSGHSDEEVLHVMGNAVADFAAKQAASRLMKVVTQDMVRLHADSLEAKCLLEQQFALRIDLAMARTKLDNDMEKLPEKQVQKLECMHSWNVEYSRTFNFTEADYDNARGSKYGKRLTHLILQWLQLLQWPTSPEEVTPPIGITWVELTVNFMLCTQSAIPVQEHQVDQGFTVRTNTFRTILMHIQFLVNKDILPRETPVKVKSLSQLGAKVMKQGLPLRPTMPKQEETLEILQRYCQEHAKGGKACFFMTPHIPIMDPVITSPLQPADEDNQKLRLKLYRERRQQLKCIHGNELESQE